MGSVQMTEVSYDWYTGNSKINEKKVNTQGKQANNKDKQLTEEIQGPSEQRSPSPVPKEQDVKAGRHFYAIKE